MFELLIVFSLLAIMGVLFSTLPVLPGPPFAIAAIMVVPLWPGQPQTVDNLTWVVSASVCALGLLITIIDFAAPWLAKMFEGTLGKSSRAAAIGSIVGLVVGIILSVASGCFGLVIPALAALPVPLILVTPFFGAVLGESFAEPPDGELQHERSGRVFRSAFVQWLGLLTTIVLKVGYALFVMPVGIWLIIRNWA
jgi:uncharacterized protein YqgC (DUF456 family)